MVNHNEMTLWAKQMVSQNHTGRQLKTYQAVPLQSLRNATKHLQLNIKKFDRPPMKKSKTTRALPDVHIAVNITPAPGAEGAVMQGTYVVSNIPITQPAAGPSAPAQVSNKLNGFSPILLLLDCEHAQRVPSVHELLRLMDLEYPTTDLRYVDVLSELQDLGVEDAVHLYSLGVPHLATFGSLGMDAARRLYKFTEEKFLHPLGLMKTTRTPSRSEKPSVEEIPTPTQATPDDIDEYDQPIKQERDKGVLEWLEKVESCKGEMEDIDEDESEDEDSDTSRSPRSPSWEI